MAVKTGTENGFSIENEFHFKGDNVIKNARDRETYEPFDDEPKAGKKPKEEEKEKEEEEGFSWWDLAGNVLAGIAVVAVTAMAATTAVVAAVGVGTAVAGTVAVAGQAISDVNNNQVSDKSAYMGGAARESFIGALSGAVFGPFGLGEVLIGKMALGGVTNAFESIIRQRIDGEGIDFKTTLSDFLIGAAGGAFFHGAGKVFKKASPFVKRGFNKIMAPILENMNAAKLALSNMSKNTKSVVLGCDCGNAGKILSQFNKELKKAKKVIKSGKGAGKVESQLYNPVHFNGTVKVNGEVRDVSRRVYQRGDININYFDENTGLSNLGRMKKGKPPIGSDGKPIQLHHLTQQEAGSMVEILEVTHQEYYGKLHGLVGKGESFRNNTILEKQYNNFRSKYWKWRYEQIRK